jgi:hypothetical protein
MIREPVTFVLLLIATLITFLLWRRARRQRIEAESQTAAKPVVEEQPVHYRLESTGTGTGYDLVRSEDGALLPLAELDWEASGLRVVEVRFDDRAMPARAAGSDIWLKAEPKGANGGVLVVTEDESERLGEVEPSGVADVRDALERGDVMRIILLDHAVAGAAVRVLLIGWGLEVSH